MSRIGFAALAVLFAVMLVRQEIAIEDLRDQLAQRPQPTSSAPALAPEPAKPGAQQLEAKTNTTLAPEEIETVRALLPIAEQAAKQVAASNRSGSPFKTDRLMGALAEIRSDPERGLATLRALATEIAAEDKQGPMLVETLQYAFKGKEIDDETADRELRAYYEMKQPYIQATAAGLLEKRGDNSLVRDFLPKIAKARLASPDRITRMYGVIDVGHTRSTLATPVLVQMIKNDPDVLVKVRATEMLEWTGGDLAARTLIQLQESRDTHPSVRDTAAKTLAKMGSPGLGLP